MLGERDLSGYRIRAARESDVAALARVHVAAWQHAYADILAPATLARTDLARSTQRFRRYFRGPERERSRLFVLDGAAGVVGYVNFGASRGTGSEPRGEVFELYLDPDFHGRGGGRKLLSAGLWALSGQRLLPAWVWVLADNARARRFYAGMGGREVARGRVRVGDEVLAQVAYAWTDALPWPEWISP